MVLLHGVLMGGSLWDAVVEGLGDRYRCVVPELPFGAHTTPMPAGADLSLPAIATLLAEFLTELDLQRVTLVCNPPTPNDSPTTSPTPNSSGSTTATPSSPSTNQKP